MEIEFGKTKLPHFDVPEGYDSWGYLNKLCTDGTERALSGGRRHAAEASGIRAGYYQAHGICGLFPDRVGFYQLCQRNTVFRWDLDVDRAAGSIVSYCLEITNIDPIRYSLLFERFLNPERVSMPDIDIDFCYERRQEVIDYVGRKYGKEKVVQIVTFGTLAAKGVIRDVGRVMDLPYSLCGFDCKNDPERAEHDD